MIQVIVNELDLFDLDDPQAELLKVLRFNRIPVDDHLNVPAGRLDVQHDFETTTYRYYQRGEVVEGGSA